MIFGKLNKFAANSVCYIKLVKPEDVNEKMKLHKTNM
jgi:hypothetical protein